MPNRDKIEDIVLEIGDILSKMNQIEELGLPNKSKV
jgi:hypothetical protein